MHRADLAELLLSLVTTPERAVSVSGDLLEESEGGAGRFWFLVARTTVRQAGRELAAAPFGMAGAAARGWLVGLGLFLVAFLTLLLPVSMVLDPMASNRVIPLLIGSVDGLLVPFMVGRWMGRRYPGREVAGCFSLAVLRFAIGICANFIFWEFVRSGGSVFHALAFGVSDAFLTLIPLLAGAAFARSRMLKSTPV